jgi:hypothetical protein
LVDAHGQFTVLTRCQALSKDRFGGFLNTFSVGIGFGQQIAHLLWGIFEMPLLYLVVVLIVVGVGLWLVNTYIPMASSIKTILNVVVVIAVGVFVLKATGLWSDVTSFRIGR